MAGPQQACPHSRRAPVDPVKTGEFHPHVLEQKPTQVYYWLKENGYQYVAFGGMEMKYLSRTYGENVTASRLDATIKEMANSPQRFSVAYQNPGFILFEVK